MLASRAHQCTKALHTIPKAALGTLRWKTAVNRTINRPHDLPVCGAGARRGWAWGVRADSADCRRMQRAYLASASSPILHENANIVEPRRADPDVSEDGWGSAASGAALVGTLTACNCSPFAADATAALVRHVLVWFMQMKNPIHSWRVRPAEVRIVLLHLELNLEPQVHRTKKQSKRRARHSGFSANAHTRGID